MTRDEAIAELRRLREWHEPIEGGGMGWAADIAYGRIDPACATCGTPDEYAVPYPCNTASVLDKVLATLAIGMVRNGAVVVTQGQIRRWHRALVMANCPDPDEYPKDAEKYLKALDELYAIAYPKKAGR